MAPSVPWPAVVDRAAELNARVSKPSKEFDDTQRLSLLSERGFSPKPEAPAVLLEVLRNQLAAESTHQSLVVGVVKKGLAIAREIAPEGAPVLDDIAILRTPVEGKKLVLVDDSVHRGETVRRLTAALFERGATEITVIVPLASKLGLERLSESSPAVKVRSTLVADEATFSFAFQAYVVPMLAACRAGAISQRPSIEIQLQSARLSREELLLQALLAVADLPFCESLSILPGIGGSYGPVLRATIHLSPEFTAGIRRTASSARDVENARLRVFITSEEPLSITILPVLYLEYPKDIGIETIENEERRASAWMMNEAASLLRQSLFQRGISAAFGRETAEIGP